MLNASLPLALEDTLPGQWAEQIDQSPIHEVAWIADQMVAHVTEQSLPRILGALSEIGHGLFARVVLGFEVNRRLGLLDEGYPPAWFQSLSLAREEVLSRGGPGLREEFEWVESLRGLRWLQPAASYVKAPVLAALRQESTWLPWHETHWVREEVSALSEELLLPWTLLLPELLSALRSADADRAWFALEVLTRSLGRREGPTLWRSAREAVARALAQVPGEDLRARLLAMERPLRERPRDVAAALVGALGLKDEFTPLLLEPPRKNNATRERGLQFLRELDEAAGRAAPAPMATTDPELPATLPLLEEYLASPNGSDWDRERCLTALGRFIDAPGARAQALLLQVFLNPGELIGARVAAAQALHKAGWPIPATVSLATALREEAALIRGWAYLLPRDEKLLSEAQLLADPSPAVRLLGRAEAGS